MGSNKVSEERFQLSHHVLDNSSWQVMKFTQSTLTIDYSKQITMGNSKYLRYSKYEYVRINYLMIMINYWVVRFVMSSGVIEEVIQHIICSSWL